MTYKDLQKKLDNMSQAELSGKVFLRDYDGDSVYPALDILPIAGGLTQTHFQIGFNCAELEGE